MRSPRIKSVCVAPKEPSFGCNIGAIDILSSPISDRTYLEPGTDEESFRVFTRRLIAVQEEERMRIARELHDDLSQRMALLSMGLEQLKTEISFVRHQNQLHALAQMADEISTAIHNISRQLHPSKVESLGLVAALSSHCRELSSPHNLQVQFEEHNVPQHIAKDIGVCLYRILQEALRNVMKHSGAKRAQVKVRGSSGGVELTISDAGTGFQVTAEKARSGLGLTSMRERLCLVNGELTIESSPALGTRVRAWVPVPESEGS